ncbi:MAG: 2-amino-4-ketopentanoate thiolase [Bacilli bacterium]|nr:2-amino-4-ketopentanoate thiolase [Bacilli bacterium]MBN2877732.1 2-amino-4-ketopentanoate thiolase [Bacilli bacterium]
MIQKNAWVQIQKTILEPSQRATHLPEETKKVPLLMWVKGHLMEPADVGSSVKIKTLTGRIESGILVCENPSYMHTYGAFVPEILQIDQIVKTKLFGGDSDE